MKTIYYPAEMDALTRFVTTIILLAIPGLLIAASLVRSPDDRIGLSLLGGVFAIFALIAWLLRPVRYEVTDDSVAIVRSWPLRDVLIDLAEVTEVRPITLPVVHSHSNAIAGLFGMFGWVTVRQYGKLFVESTNGHKNVLLDGARKFVVSPDRPEEFIRDVECRLRVSGSATDATS